MAPTFSLCIPFRADHGAREAAFNWLCAFYHHALPEAEICIGEEDADAPVVNRSRMRNNAAAKATTDILCFLDADGLIDPADIRRAVAQVQQGSKLVKFRGLHWLTQAATKVLLQATPSEVMPTINVQCSAEFYTLDFGGLFFGMTRATFEEMGKWDTRAEEWGEEDIFVNIIAGCLYGTIDYITTACYHLWHEADHRNTGTPSFLRNQAMTEEYAAIAATGDAALMRTYCHDRPPFFYDPRKPRKDVVAVFRFHHALCFTSVVGAQYFVANGYEGSVPNWIRGTREWRTYRSGDTPLIEMLVDDLLEVGYELGTAGQ
jgi:glycosyltransferase involved in cell wall biosynthesis